MYSCVLCNNPDEWTRGLCSKCEELKKIVDVYSIEQVIESIKYIYVRNETPISNRTRSQKKIKESGDQ